MALDNVSSTDDNLPMQATPRKLINYHLADGREPVKEWLLNLKDANGKAKIIDRLERVELGNLGKTEKAGDGVLELKVNVGPGYRVYVYLDGPVVVILLCGGDKHTQDKDIRLAKAYLADYKSSRG